jgi:hypothetical protein
VPFGKIRVEDQKASPATRRACPFKSKENNSWTEEQGVMRDGHLRLEDQSQQCRNPFRRGIILTVNIDLSRLDLGLYPKRMLPLINGHG